VRLHTVAERPLELGGGGVIDVQIDEADLIFKFRP
jgi:hypothetical protein